MVPYSWVSEYLKMFVIRNGEVNTRRVIFQSDSLSPLFFVLCMIPLTWFLRRAKAGLEWDNNGFKLNHLLFMDDLKLQFVREIPETTDEKETWNWLRKAELKIEMEAMLCVAQEQAIRTNYVKHKIDKTAQSPLCRMCD